MAPVRSWGSLAAAAAAMIIIVRANDHEAIAAEAKDLFGGAAQGLAEVYGRPLAEFLKRPLPMRIADQYRQAMVSFRRPAPTTFSREELLSVERPPVWIVVSAFLAASSVLGYAFSLAPPRRTKGCAPHEHSERLWSVLRADSAEALGRKPPAGTICAVCLEESTTEPASSTAGDIVSCQCDSEHTCAKDDHAPSDWCRTVCGHWFHSDCLERWLLTAGPGRERCPLCNDC
eukprot:TRINITY_DN7896_c0_g2_i4.p1 TRINITY_DN7896_c0_g2~~TRINITY_DN7896_c0_g2_i4.p1  ORF type:complete len:231 (-),score=21.40 TRINITY_DN7896_c0_g2_i4:38-730(-)